MTEFRFGIVSTNWRIFNGAIDLQPDRISVVKDGFRFDDTLFDGTLQNLQPTGLRRLGSTKIFNSIFYIATRFDSMVISSYK